MGARAWPQGSKEGGPHEMRPLRLLWSPDQVGDDRKGRKQKDGSSITNVEDDRGEKGEDDRGGEADTTRSFTSFRMTGGGRSRMTEGGKAGRTEGGKESLRLAQKIFLCGILG